MTLQATYDAQFAQQLLEYLQGQLSLTAQQQMEETKFMHGADDLYAAMPGIELPVSTDSASLELFFTEEVMQRLLICPRINVDLLDCWGFFGTEPGFILIMSMRYRGARTLADEVWLQGRSFRPLPGSSLLAIGSWDSFPCHKFHTELFTPTRNREVFRFLVERIHRQKPNSTTDISALVTETGVTTLAR